jgi:hypothetical protein
MSGIWELTGIELVVLWEKLHAEHLPPPLIFTSDTRYADDYRGEKDATWDCLRDKLDGTLAEVLGHACRPDVRVVVHGADPRDSSDPRGLVRLLGARAGHRAVLIRQLPGRTIWHSGGYVVTACEPEALAGLVVDALPAFGAGRTSDVVLVRDCDDNDMDHWYGRSAVHDTFDETERRSNTWLRAPACAIGTIDIIQGTSVFGPRGITQHRIMWRDQVADGRYAVPDVTPLTAIGVDSRRLTAMIDTRIARVVQTLEDERC